MKSIGMLFLALVIGAGVVSGCAEKKEPGEKASEAVEAVKETGEEMGEAAGEMAEEAGGAVEEMGEEAGEGMEAAGAKMAEATEAVEEKAGEMMAAAEEMAAPESIEKGAALYKAKCAACHGTGGKGTAMAPAFAGNEWVDGAAHDEMVDVIVNGRQGADKRYKKFALGMPAQKGMSEGDVSALVDYIRSID